MVESPLNGLSINEIIEILRKEKSLKEFKIKIIKENITFQPAQKDHEIIEVDKQVESDEKLPERIGSNVK